MMNHKVFYLRFPIEDKHCPALVNAVAPTNRIAVILIHRESISIRLGESVFLKQKCYTTGFSDKKQNLC